MVRYGSSERPDLPLAVVVGAGAMGMAAARRMAQSHRVLLADVDAARAEAEAGRMRAEGMDAAAMRCDVTCPDDVAALADSVTRRGGLGTLVQVAGLSPSAGDFGLIVRVNLMGPARIVAALLPHARQGSSAILVASMAAHLSTPDEAARAVLADPGTADLADRLAAVLGPDGATPQVAYACSKFGLLMLARMQAAAWGARGARIVSLSPGLIATPMGAQEFAASEGKRAMFARSPLAREGTMIEIADAVEFLASPRASFISGTDLLVDGGLSGTLRGGG